MEKEKKWLGRKGKRSHRGCGKKEIKFLVVWKIERFPHVSLWIPQRVVESCAAVSYPLSSELFVSVVDVGGDVFHDLCFLWVIFHQPLDTG